MKQLYAAGSLSRTPAPAVRAASAGVASDELNAALASVTYTPPPARNADDGRPLPVRLALLNTTSGRVLTHTAPNGGTYFAHALLDVPSTADAQLAIQTWGSPQWQRHDPDGGSALPELPYLPVADVLDDGTLQEWLTVPVHREMLEFVLMALLGTPATTRIYLAAPADVVAKVVYAVTRALPPGLLDDLTFSTYEPDPLACSARLVGFDAGSAERDLPNACYSHGAVGFNLASGRRSEIGTGVSFASFAVNALATGSLDELDELKATWQRLALRELGQFNLVYRLGHGSSDLTKTEAAEILQHPPLAAWVSGRPEVLSQFLNWALDDQAFATTSFSRALQALRQKPDVAAKLGQTVREQGLASLQAGDRTRTATALEVLLPMVSPAKANLVWGDLIGQIPDPSVLTWEMRAYLLPRLVRFKHQQGTAGVDPALVKWVEVPSERFGDLLALELPRAYHLAGGRLCLSRVGEPSESLTRTLGANPDFALALLRPDDATVDADRSVQLFESLLREVASHPWFEELLTRAADYPAGLLNRFFESALAAGKVVADRVIRTQGPRLLELFAGQSGLDRVGSQLLGDPPADLLRNDGLLDFLARLRDEPQVSDDLKRRIEGVQIVRSYVDNPSFDSSTMSSVSSALAVTPPVLPSGTKDLVFDAVATGYLRQARGGTAQVNLEAVLVHFGDVLASGPTDLYENLLRSLRGRTDLGRNPDLAYTFLAVALGAVRSPELVGKLDGLDGHAFAVASDTATRGGNRLLNTIDRRTSDWPKAARSQWGFLLAAVRPQGFKRVLRDVAFLLAGGGLATAAWWLVKVLS